MPEKLSRVSKKAENWLHSVASILLILIVVCVFEEVISRYIFGEAHSFIVDFTTWSMIWITFLLVGLIAKTRDHVSVDILPNRIPYRYKNPLLIFIDIISLIFAILMCWAGAEHIQLVYQLGNRSTSAIPTPMWIVRLCVPLGGLFLAFFSIEHLVADIRSLIKRKREKE